MRHFLRENWVYIAVPLVILLLGAAAMMIFSDSSASPFNYPIW